MIMASVTFGVTGAYAFSDATPVVRSQSSSSITANEFSYTLAEVVKDTPPPPLYSAAVDRLKKETGASVSLWRSTGGISFVSLNASQASKLTAALASAGKTPLGGKASARDLTEAFFTRYGDAFGIRDISQDLVFNAVSKDKYGAQRVSYVQTYKHVPVFASKLNAHINADGDLMAVNGMFVPDIALTVTPNISAQRAGELAMAEVNDQFTKKVKDDARGTYSLPLPVGLRATGQKLYVYRTGLVKGVIGKDHLVYEVQVTNMTDVNEWLYIDAHTGKLVEQFTGIHHNHEGVADAPNALRREVYEATLSPAALVWQEGKPLPFVGSNNNQTRDVNSLINTSGEIYGMFKNAFGYVSFDNKDTPMQMINNSARLRCPNAQWTGLYTQFCVGVAGDDTVAHEWAHAYTQYTSDLIYAWQPGALNEAYSDIWGEVVDMLNKSGSDYGNDALRNPNGNVCSASTPGTPQLAILSPNAIAGVVTIGSADFGPRLTSAGVRGEVVLANDGKGSNILPPNATTETSADACTPLVNASAVAGKIAMVYRGTCLFVEKVKNAQAAGAIGVIVMNHAEDGDRVLNMSGSDVSITIPAVFVGYGDGAKFVSQLNDGNSVVAHMSLGGGTETDNTLRWLSGEDDPAIGAIRDMWNPTCYRDPGKVTDKQYFCSTDDGGGVHHNSGVVNHAFALMVDGGNYNKQTIRGIGLTKAAHIFWRAQSTYLTRVSDFSDHADALEQSCKDLRGKPLAALSLDNVPSDSGQSINDEDCEQVNKTNLAVEFRTQPAQCNFEPLLAKDTPALCTAKNGPAKTIFVADFETNPFVSNSANAYSTWSTVTKMYYPDFPTVNWAWTKDMALPGGRAGRAVFADNNIDNDGNCSESNGDSTREMRLVSPYIQIPANISTPRIAFNNFIMTELNYDGGIVFISVNGGDFKPIARNDFIFNPYNDVFRDGSAFAGKAGFTGTDEGTVKGSWGQSQINLAPYAKAGDTIRLRFDFGTDGCGGINGWYVDDVQVYYCENQALAINTKASQDLITADGKTFVPVTANLRTTSGPIVNELLVFTTGRFRSPLSGANEVPIAATTNGGRLDFSYDVSTKLLSYRIEAYGIERTTAIQILLGKAGSVGEVVVNLPIPADFPARPATGQIIFTELGESALLQNQFFINIRTAKFPNGELRAHIADGHFSSALSGKTEVPQNQSAGRGTAFWTYDAFTRNLYYRVDVSGLENITAAHIHRGKAGENGPVAHNIIPAGSTLTNGVPLVGMVTLSIDDEVRLYNNELYINVHTQANPAGEIRGQIIGGMVGVTDANGNATVMVSAIGPMGMVGVISNDSRGIVPLLSPNMRYNLPIVFVGDYVVP
jgi:Zn-dependent metalloprotease